MFPGRDGPVCRKFAVIHCGTSAYIHDKSGVWTGSRAAKMKQTNEGEGPEILLDDEFSAALEAMIEEIRTQPVTDRLRDLSHQLQEALNRAGKVRKGLASPGSEAGGTDP